MVLVDVVIAEGVNKITHFQIANVRHQVSEQGIRADVERHAEKCVCRTLIKLAMKNAAPVNLELKQRVARWQVDIVALARVPPRHNQTSRVGIGFDLADQTGNLIHPIEFRIMPPERTPQITINRPEV